MFASLLRPCKMTLAAGSRVPGGGGRVDGRGGRGHDGSVPARRLVGGGDRRSGVGGRRARVDHADHFAVRLAHLSTTQISK